MTAALVTVGEWAAFVGRSFFAALLALPRPQLWLKPLHNVLVGGLPLATVAGLTIGVVIWVHTRGVLARTGTGAVELLPTFLSAAVLLELAPIAAGLILAARTGASLGAEFASLKVSEQVDALELLGVSPVRRLVGPRVLACVLAGPLLHVLIAGLAVGGGFVAESLSGQTTYLRYTMAVLKELYLSDVLPAGLKPLVFGLLTGATGCFLGLRAGGGSEGVGRSATDSVVACSLLVLLADVLLVGLIQIVGG